MSKERRPNQKEYQEMKRLKIRVDSLMDGGGGIAGVSADAVATVVQSEFGVEYTSQEIVDIYSTGRKLGRDR